MNSLNALGNRQIASLQADLSRMESGEAGPSVQGELLYTLSYTAPAHDERAKSQRHLQLCPA